VTPAPRAPRLLRPGRSLIELLVLSGALFAAACTYKADIPSGELERAQRPALQESWDVVLNISEEGNPRIRIAGWHMERYDDPDSLFTLLDNNPDVADDRVRTTIYDSTGVVSAELTAESVRFDESGEQLIANGDVRVHASSGRLLESENLRWNQADRRIVVPGFVYLETEDEKIRGFDLEAQEDLSTYVIRRIAGTVVIRENEE